MWSRPSARCIIKSISCGLMFQVSILHFVMSVVYYCRLCTLEKPRTMKPPPKPPKPHAPGRDNVLSFFFFLKIKFFSYFCEKMFFGVIQQKFNSAYFLFTAFFTVCCVISQKKLFLMQNKGRWVCGLFVRVLEVNKCQLCHVGKRNRFLS